MSRYGLDDQPQQFLDGELLAFDVDRDDLVVVLPARDFEGGVLEDFGLVVGGRGGLDGFAAGEGEEEGVVREGEELLADFL